MRNYIGDFNNTKVRSFVLNGAPFVLFRPDVGGFCRTGLRDGCARHGSSLLDQRRFSLANAIRVSSDIGQSQSFFTKVRLAALDCAFRSARFRVFRLFRRPLWRPANKATAWPPCSWVELQAVLGRPEFWVSQLVRSPTSETGVYREFAADRSKSLLSLSETQSG